MKYNVKFPIGSTSGHGRIKYFYFESNKSPEDIAKIHLRSKEVLGFNIGDICCEYEDSYIRGDILNRLISLDIFDGSVEEYIKDGELFIEGPEEIMHIWKKCLILIDPVLVLDPNTPTYFDIKDYGYGRMKTPGYGVM